MSTYTITFGEVSITHRAMAGTGAMFAEGLTKTELEYAKEKAGKGELIDLREQLPKAERPMVDSEPVILVIRNGVQRLIDTDPKELFDEQETIPYDSKAVMYGRVVNAMARHHMCFSDVGQKADLENNKGTVAAFSETPLLSKLKNAIEDLLPAEKRNLTAQGNFYYDIKKCGIGYHGDAERKIVVGVRLGETMPLKFVWYRESRPITEPFELMLNSGDIIFMSEKATGNDWKKRKSYTLRHAAGCDKFTTLKKKTETKNKVKRTDSETSSVKKSKSDESE
eukprot:TRINITY_DN240_c13_g1_i1.p1 TRINITY_DN240_c13_g1~~TRINITY_DN240_c13_g1_i1.p1  ORF type:complete len:281 (+),score=53.23 TRINITY_DN240_c13_g1_i1:61-903(+)